MRSFGAVTVAGKNSRSVMGNKTHVLRFRAVDRNIFNAIRNGKKKIETRAATPRYRNIKVGDVLVFRCGKTHFRKTALRVNVYKTIESLARKYKPKEINPAVSTIEELRKTYFSFSGYREKIKKYGLIAVRLK